MSVTESYSEVALTTDTDDDFESVHYDTDASSANRSAAKFNDRNGPSASYCDSFVIVECPSVQDFEVDGNDEAVKQGSIGDIDHIDSPSDYEHHPQPRRPNRHRQQARRAGRRADDGYTDDDDDGDSDGDGGGVDLMDDIDSLRETAFPRDFTPNRLLGPAAVSPYAYLHQRLLKRPDSPTTERVWLDTFMKTPENAWSHTKEMQTSLGTFQLLCTKSGQPSDSSSRLSTVTRMEWGTFFLTHSPQERYSHIPALRTRIFSGGIESSIRPEVWMLLLGVHSWASNSMSRSQVELQKRSEYERMKSKWRQSIHRLQDAPPELAQPTPDFVMPNVLAFWKENLYRIDKDVVRTDREVYFYQSTPSFELLAYQPGAYIDACPNRNLEKLRNVLMTYSVRSTLKPYTLYQKTEEDLQAEGYVQGMAELASSILMVMDGDESNAFWTFYALMERMKKHYRSDGSGMRTTLITMGKLIRILDPELHLHLLESEALDLFCCFRWFLVLFKREFRHVALVRLWDAIFAKEDETQDYAMFVAMAILEEHRDEIMQRQSSDEIWKVRTSDCASVPSWRFPCMSTTG
ncbi:rab-GTPase-TBC domain-containing protein, partial [Polychytrium aggregatum]|uniref:rab-GTPase-TBC domain-containing protein n=1 Tax=Polychytrium aggregatum TaxID=110093 RepID=UPI0022FF1546